MQQHTKTPAGHTATPTKWEVKKTPLLEMYGIYEGKRLITHFQERETPNKIVTAVNSHEALVEALEAAQGFIEEGTEDNDEPDPMYDSLMKRIRAALQKAKQ